MRSRNGSAGASLIETLVAFGLTVAAIASALFLFAFHQRLAQAHLDDSALQQAQQAAQRELRRALRTAGRGGIAGLTQAEGPRPELAITVEQDVAVGHPVGTVTAAGGTDVLVVRGVMNGPLYWVEGYHVDPATRTGWVDVQAETAAGIRQPLAMLQEAGEAGEDALFLLSGVGRAHAVAPITEFEVSGRGRRRRIRVHFAGDPSRGPIAAAYLELSSGGSWPAGRMDVVERIGVLEEWRFYIRPVDEASGRDSQLVRARFYPGTGIAWRRRQANLTQPIADGIVDLEAAVEDPRQDGGWTVRVATTARAGPPGATLLRVDRTAASLVRPRNLR